MDHVTNLNAGVRLDAKNLRMGIWYSSLPFLWLEQIQTKDWFIINMYNSILTIERRKTILCEEQGKVMMVERVKCITMTTKAQKANFINHIIEKNKILHRIESGCYLYVDPT